MFSKIQTCRRSFRRVDFRTCYMPVDVSTVRYSDVSTCMSICYRVEFGVRIWHRISETSAPVYVAPAQFLAGVSSTLCRATLA